MCRPLGTIKRQIIHNCWKKTFKTQLGKSTRQENEIRYTDWKESSITILVDDITLNKKIPKNLLQLLELINKSRETIGLKINAPNQFYFIWLQ